MTTEAYWMCRFEFGELTAGQVQVEKFMKKTAVLVGRPHVSGYVTRVSRDDIFTSRAAAVLAKEPKVRSYISTHREMAARAENALNDLLPKGED